MPGGVAGAQSRMTAPYADCLLGAIACCHGVEMEKSFLYPACEMINEWPHKKLLLSVKAICS